MNAPVKISAVSIVKDDPAAIFRDPNLSVSTIADELRKQNDGEVNDLGTDKGRKAIASRAHAVTKLKTAMDGAGKELNASKRAEIEAVDKIRREVREKLDAVKEGIRAPLDRWEEQEQARKDQHGALITQIENATFVSQDDDSASIGERIEWLEGLDLSEAALQEFSAAATGKANFALNNLRSAHEKAKTAEAERAELERLRAIQAEQEKRDAAERAERQAKEKAEAEEREAVEAEEKRKREAAEQAAIAAETARKEAEDKAARERKALIEEQDRKERERLDNERREREAAEERARDKEHRKTVNQGAVSAIMEAAGIGEDRATKIVTAIASGAVPHVSITY